jgi:hypothetical protein
MIRIASIRFDRDLARVWRLGLGICLLLISACGGGGSDGGSMNASTQSAPVITGHPMSMAATAGGTATFSVTASGDAPLSFQWLRDGTAIPGATIDSYTTPVLTTGDSGATFAVQVSNRYGNVTSSPAVLSVM